MRRIHEYIIVLLLCCMSAPVWSQDGEQAAVSTREQRELNKILNTPVPHKYKFWDNLFFGGSFGANYSLSEYVRQENFFKMLRPQVDLSFGKYMNKSIAMRVGLFFMSQEASIPQDAQNLLKDIGNYEPYNFCMVGAKLDFMFNLNRLVRRYRPNERFSLWAVAGVDCFRTFGFQSKVKEWYEYYPIEHGGKWNGSLHAGLEAHLRRGDHYSLVFSGLWHAAPSGYNGQPLDNKTFRNFVSVNIGFIYRFTNSKGEIGFHNCKHNENYYFDSMNRRLKRHYLKYDDDNAILQDTIITFPYHYSYLTPLQKEKLEKMMKRMQSEPDMQVQIDVYSDGDESPVYNQFRAENRRERIHDYVARQNAGLLPRISITQHTESAPMPVMHNWSSAGIIRITKQ